MIITLVTILHVLVSIILILIVLLQSGGRTDIASAFGGASTQAAFGARGPASFLQKLTAWSAAIFMTTCLALSILSVHTTESTVLEKVKTTQQKPAPPADKPAQPKSPQQQQKHKQQSAPQPEKK